MQERSQLESPLDIQRHMLRGVPANLVLRRRARLLNGAAGSEATFSVFEVNGRPAGRCLPQLERWSKPNVAGAFSSLVFPQRSSLWGPHCRSTVCASSLEWLSLSAVDDHADLGPLLASGISRPTFALSGGARLRPRPTWGQPGRFRSGRCGPKLKEEEEHTEKKRGKQEEKHLGRKGKEWDSQHGPWSL